MLAKTTNRITWATLLLCGTVFAAVPVLADTIVAPSGAGNAQGPAPFNYYGTGGSRNQEVYGASLFGAASGPIMITEIDFRSYPGAAPSGLFGDTLNIANVNIQLSTTSFGDETGTALSTNFADNIGADVMTVYSGALTLHTTNPGSFDYSVVLATPFLYDPTAGNLLLDVNIPVGSQVSGNGAFGFLTFDNANTINDSIYSVVNLQNGSATSGTADTSGAITQFVFTPADVTAAPEPLTLSLFGAGLLGMGIGRRRKAS